MGSENGSIPPTDMLYLSFEGNFELECQANVVSVECQQTDGDDNATATVDVCLDRTCMHAQGGGQPTDVGRIVCQLESAAEKVVVEVEKVTLDRETGVATHRGKLIHSGNDDLPMCLPVGTPAHVTVDADQRQILSECHTAGHVVDSAMGRCGKMLRPTKGYHFLDGPYVEYKGSIPPEERDAFLKELQHAFQDLVAEDIATNIQTVAADEANEICNRVAHNFDMKDFGGDKADAQIRVVTVAGFPCPCGGTHVKSTGALKERNWGILRLRSKKGVVRIRYGQNATK